MQAVILAGGKGTRLSPYTMVLPKPLMPIIDKPILEIVIRQLVTQGFDHIIITVNHLADLIKAFFGNGEKFGVKIDYSMEDKPLGTIGPIASLSSLLEDDFIVMNGDVLTNLNYLDIFSFHKKNDCLMTVGLHRSKYQIDLGYILKDTQGFITDYIEKPTHYFDVAMGISVLSKKVLNNLKIGERKDMPEIVLELIRANKKVLAYENNAYWLDIGRKEEYELALSEYELKGDAFFNLK